MPKSKAPANKKTQKSSAAWRIALIYVLLGTLAFALMWWARTNTTSKVAQSLRDLTGIVLWQEPAANPAPEAIEPVIEPEPEAEPIEVVQEPTPPPEPKHLNWNEFKNLSNLWPASLEITVDKTVALTYRGKIFGEVAFNTGQNLSVINFSDNGFVYGRINGNDMEVHLAATNFNAWFKQQHGELYTISYPEKNITQPKDGFEEELITRLRIWCMTNYNTPLIEILESKLVLRMPSVSGQNTTSGYSLEALSVARAYLQIQDELGGNDTYASCEIRDSKTGALLGSNGLFIPKL